MITTGCPPSPFGCTDIAACNYDETADIDDGSCILPGCTDPAACNYDAAAICDDWDNTLCTYPGCTDPAACNYDATSTCDDGTCNFGLWYLPNNLDEGPVTQACSAPAGYYLADQACIEAVIAVDPFCVNNNWDNVCMRAYNCCLGIYGCNVPSACNYDPEACSDNTLCTYPGCTDPAACNYDDTAGCDDGSCLASGCTHISACNYDASASCDNGSCEFLTCRGCTGQMACNYNPNASIDDGSCEYVTCAGCTVPSALNYDSTATLDDGSCEFETGQEVDPCPFDLNDDGGVGTSDLLDLLGAFGTVCPE